MTDNTKNIKWHNTRVMREMREKFMNQVGCTIWLTGLPASGKSTTAYNLEYMLMESGHLSFVLDGDNIRHRLNKNLGFSTEDRQENIRRISEVALLFCNAGLVTITSFISPYRKDRDLARNLHNEVGVKFIEVFVNASVETCVERDPKGLYKIAQKGEIKGFTGINAPYEEPLSPEIVLNSEEGSASFHAKTIFNYLKDNDYLKTIE